MVHYYLSYRTLVRFIIPYHEVVMRATRKLAAFLKPYWLWAILGPLFMVLEVAMDLMQPRLIERIVDQGIARSDMHTVLTTAAWMVGLALIGLLGGLGSAVFAIMAGQGFGADLRGVLFRKVQALSFGNLDRLETGGLITRLTNDVTQLQELVMMLLRIMVRVPLLLVGSLIMAILTSPQLAMLFLGLIPIVLVALVVVINKSFPMFGEVQRRLDTLNTVLQENLAGVRVVKAFARAHHERGRFGRANDRLMEQNLMAVRTTAVTMPFMMLALNAGVVAALWIGGVRIVAGSLQAGQLIAFINYLMQTLMSLMMVSMLIIRVSRAEASAQRVDEVLENEPDIRKRPQAVTEFAPRGRVAFENVSFSFSGDDHDPVLKGISFVAEPGQTVALLGATGAGKSSLVNLIPRFYDCTSGRITIDGMDVRAVDETALHRAIGAALQEAVLFSGTIRDNIRYGRPDASDDEVIAAARMAEAHDFISRFPNGYDTIVGQRGVNLSGGQKQRIAIARALLVQPAVLILDDSTSAVDIETEARIQAALAEGGRQTRFVVAQRISTVLQADKILVLDDGRIAAEGRHDELIRTSSIYREIYESQMEHGAVTHGTA
jgi:ATP-binding cassette subfamily B protein